MDALALAIRHAVYPAWVLKNRSARLRYLAQLEKSQFWTARRLQEHQWAAFKRMVEHAVGTCPFYREKFSAAGLEVADLRSPEDIQAVPTLSKEEIQENRDAMISADFRKETLLPDMTGGSTGSPMSFFYDTDRRDSREAAALRHDRWSGWNIGDRRAVLWGAPPVSSVLSLRSAANMPRCISMRKTCSSRLFPVGGSRKRSRARSSSRICAISPCQ
jgi:phenylacetate-CoA ligase